ncbi:MAG: C45 family peptidase, partial [Bacteroidota bacterium]
IIKTYDKGFYEIKENGLKVLHLAGTGYERGYQYGIMLKDEIEESIKTGTTLFATYIGDGDYDLGLKRLFRGKEVMEPYIPKEFMDEMKGMADALKEAGSDITYDDIIMWNTINDSKMLHKGPRSIEEDLPAGKLLAYPDRGGCMSVAAFNDATTDGSMIVGKNMDWYCSPGMRKNPIILVVKPTDGGYGYLAPVYPGWFACIEGVNEKGITTGMQISKSDYETMRGAGWHALTALILKYSDSLDDAINILTVYPKPCGNIFQVNDGKVNNAVVIETTANALAVRYPVKDKNVLWTTNHFNCYPGWDGYDGSVNMPAQQEKFYKLDLTSGQSFYNSVPMWTKGRYDRTRELLNENYGKISVEKMVEFVSDRYCMIRKENVGWDVLDGACIADVWANDRVIAKDVQYFKSDYKGDVLYTGGNIWSLVMSPKTGDVEIAMAGSVPAQKEGFKHINLFEELARMD